MAGQPAPIPTSEDIKRTILCIEDLKQAGSKKMPEDVRGTLTAIERTIATTTDAI